MAQEDLGLSLPQAVFLRQVPGYHGPDLRNEQLLATQTFCELGGSIFSSPWGHYHVFSLHLSVLLPDCAG